MREADNTKLIIASIMLLFAVFTAPAGALIATSIEATFDAKERTAGFGEEIQVQITISPGDAEIRNLSIVLSERDALIDDRSFRHTIVPTGAPVNVERNGHSFTCDQLAQGESVVLSFNAYPKTLSQSTLTVADVTYTYVQRGEILQGDDMITVDTSSSLWFQNLALSDGNSLSWTFYLGILLIFASLALLAYQRLHKGKVKSSANAENQKLRRLLEEVSVKLELIPDNPSMGGELRRKIDRELKSGAFPRVPVDPIPDKDNPIRKSRF